MKYPALNLSAIKMVPNFPEDQYVKTAQVKKQIVLHHTASGPGVQGDINWWLTDPRRVGTCVLIDRNGDIYQCFGFEFWAGHLGTTRPNNAQLDRNSLGPEIDAWGPLVDYQGKFYPYMNNARPVPKEDVTTYEKPIKTFPGDKTNPTFFDKVGVVGKPVYHYHKYTDEQILSTAKLCEYWGNLYKIPLTYNPAMWTVNEQALSGAPGIWTHGSYRVDKFDCHPQPELIAMLKSLTV